MSDKLIRTLHPEVRIISEAEGLVDYIASDESVDSYSEVIAAKGWRFTRFEKNAPFVDSHNYWSIDKLVGRVVSVAVRGKQLVERVQWAKDVDENALAKLGWRMTVGGFLKAVSVGFFPVRLVGPHSDDWGKVVADMKIPVEDAAKLRRIYLEQEQIELSACIIGANPNALAKAHQEGCVRDADLASVGFEDEDMEFLHLAAKGLEQKADDPLLAIMVEREIRRITARKNLRNAGEAPAPSASTPAGADEEAKRQAQRSRFLSELRQLQ